MYDYGFDKTSNLLFASLIQYPPDFQAAQKLIEEGASVHAKANSGDDENILAQIILGYPHIDIPEGVESEEDLSAFWKQYDGKYLPSIVQFFLDNGFDVTLENERYGADCLRNLTWSSYDRYILDAAKLLLNAGASYNYIDEDNESVIDWVGTKASASPITDEDDEAAQLFCTMWEILDAHRKEQPFEDIDSCLCCEGLIIDHILVGNNPNEIRMRSNDNTIIFAEPIFLICQNTPLRINTWAEVAVDSRGSTEASNEDANNVFCSVIGQQITKISFPKFAGPHNGMKEPNFTIDLSNGISIQCRACKINEVPHLEMLLYSKELNT